MDKMIFKSKFMTEWISKILTKLIVNKINKAYPEINGNPEVFINDLDFSHGDDRTKIHIDGDIYVSSELFRKLLSELI